MSSKLRVFYSTSSPAAIVPGAVHIFENGTYLQMGLVLSHPVTVSSTDLSMLLLTSEIEGAPDAGLYTKVIKILVSAYRDNALELIGSTVVDEAPPSIPVATLATTTAKPPKLFVQYFYTSNSSDEIIANIRVMDVHGFILAYNSAVILANVSTTATAVSSLDVLLRPTAPVSLPEGDFSQANPQLLTNKDSEPSQYFNIPALWYGSLAVAPATLDTKQVCIWRDITTQKLKYGIALPLDELLTKPTNPFTAGIVNDLPNSAKCYGDKFWYLLKLDEATGSTGDSSFVAKVLAAANHGVLFMSPRVATPLTTPAIYTYHSAPYSLTINFAVYHGTSFSRTIGNFYDQGVYITAIDHTGAILASYVERVRIECSTGLSAVFPHDGFLFGTPCNTVGCNSYSSKYLLPNGANSGINVLQGRGNLPTGTEIVRGEGANYWDISRLTDSSLAGYFPDPRFYFMQSPSNISYLPYLGKKTNLHTNHSSRAAALDYTHYYYPDNYFPLDIGVAATFGTVVVGSNLQAWTNSTAAIVSDDDDLFAVQQSLLGKSVFLLPPKYSTQYLQASQKDLILFLPNRESQFTTLPIESSNYLSLDLSTLRLPTPIMTQYGVALDEYQCIATYQDNSLHFKPLVNIVCGGNCFIGFSSKAFFVGYTFSHSLHIPDNSSSKALTGLTNYPEYAAAFTTPTNQKVVTGDTAPLVPTFNGRLPPNYKFIWVDWSSVTNTDITIYYWEGETSYVSSTWTASPNTQSYVIPLELGASGLINFTGLDLFTLEMVKVGTRARLRIFMGDTLLAVSNDTTLPWIGAGAAYLHAHGGSDLEELVFSDIRLASGVKASPLENATSSHYVELQLEVINTQITAGNYLNLDLKPYTLYWDTYEKALYFPIVDNLLKIPTRLAKTKYFKNSPTNALLVELLSHTTPTERIFISPNHGLTEIPAGANYHLFSALTYLSASSFSFYWRKGLGYTNVVGPMLAETVPGVVVPSAVKTPYTGASTDLVSSASAGNNMVMLDDTLFIQGLDLAVAYTILPLSLPDPNAKKFSFQFTRKQIGAWAFEDNLYACHFAVSLVPYRPSYLGSGVRPIDPKPQLRGFRVLFPNQQLPIKVMSSAYTGYGWNSELESDQAMRTMRPYVKSGSGVLTGYDGNTLIGITCSEVEGEMLVEITENQQLRQSVKIPIPYFNNGSIVLSLRHVGTQASEVLANLDLVVGEVKLREPRSTDLIYCVPTTTAVNQALLRKEVEQVVTQLNHPAIYGLLDYSITNTQAFNVVVTVYLGTGEPNESSMIGRYTIKPQSTARAELIHIHKDEKLVMVSSEEVQVSTSILAQLTP